MKSDIYDRVIADMESKLNLVRSLTSPSVDIQADVVEQLRSLYIVVDARNIAKVASVCERAAREIERLRKGLSEIAGMGETPFCRQSIRAREIAVGDVDQSTEHLLQDDRIKIIREIEQQSQKWAADLKRKCTCGCLYGNHYFGSNKCAKCMTCKGFELAVDKENGKTL